MQEKHAGVSEAPIDPTALFDAIESDRFKQFLDHVPVAVAVSELHPSEIVTYANLEFQKLTGHGAAEIEGKSWRTLTGTAAADGDDRELRDAVCNDSDYIGVFTIDRDDGPIEVDAWSNTIENDDGEPIYRLVALGAHITADQRRARAAGIADQDVRLKELQHRVKNNLQMITSLIRLEARNSAMSEDGDRFARLAGRVNALALLYGALSVDEADDDVDLGAYLGQIASAVMQAHGTEGIRLDSRIDSWPVSINVAMPTGLVVNEVLTNSLKHAFAAEKGGVITLDSLIDDDGCHITIADNGRGLAEGLVWPTPGSLGAIIVDSLKKNAGARISTRTTPGEGVAVTISFRRC